jgi:hypothetical protein
MRRHELPGYVYIAGSPEGRLIKIGASEDLRRRENQLRAGSYGGYSDWRMPVAAWLRNRGKTESEMSSRTAGKRIYAGYIKDGHSQTAATISAQ